MTESIGGRNDPMKIKLTRKEKEYVMKWLETANYFRCPFWSSDYVNPHKIYKSICFSWFPKSNENHCPCDKYKLSTVIRRAREMIT